VIRRIFFILPFFAPYLFGYKFFQLSDFDLYWVLIGIAVGLAFLLPIHKTLFLCFNKDFIMLSKKRTNTDYISNIILLLSLAILEELFFREFIYTINGDKYILIAVLLSAILFVANHIGTKWGDKFDKKDVLIQFFFSLFSFALMYFSGSIIPSIIAHVTFNLPHVLISCKQLYVFRNSSKSEDS